MVDVHPFIAFPQPLQCMQPSGKLGALLIQVAHITEKRSKKPIPSPDCHTARRPHRCGTDGLSLSRGLLDLGPPDRWECIRGVLRLGMRRHSHAITIHNKP